MCNLKLNQELNGVELYFDDKPKKQVRDYLSSKGFRWSGFKKCWYAKQSEKTLKVAEELTGINQEAIIKEVNSVATTTKIKNNKTVLSLWDRVQFQPGTANTNKYNYKFVGSNYTGLTTKETAKIIRQHLKTRFPEVKFSVTSEYSKIDIDIKQSPYSNNESEQLQNTAPWKYQEWQKKNNPELISIAEYCKKLLSSYNYDDSDSMSDYFNTHFYSHVSIDWKYKQTEQTEVIKADIINFRNQLEQEAQAEEVRKEQEYKEFLRKKEEDEIRHQEWLIEETRQKDIINNSVKIINLKEEDQYFVIGSQFAKLNKNNTLEEYKEEVAKDEYYLQDVKITKEIYFNNEEALNYFSNLLLSDFDFLVGAGGSFTDDVRINSITDYHNMDEEEQKTVIWNLYGVAIYHNSKLKFIVDPQGHNYARYVGLVDNVKIQKEYNVKQFINPVLLEELKQVAETLKDISFNVITEKNIVNTWHNENWTEYKELMKEQLKKYDIRLSKAIIQQLPEDMEQLKISMYKLLIEVDSIQEQFKNAELQQGQKLTLFYISEYGSIITSRITFNNVEYVKYAQYNNAIKLTFKPEGKIKSHYNYFHGTLLVYNGWLSLPEEVLNIISQTEAGVRITRSKYLSCDKKQYDEILNHFASDGIKPIINTYKPEF